MKLWISGICKWFETTVSPCWKEGTITSHHLNISKEKNDNSALLSPLVILPSPYLKNGPWELPPPSSLTRRGPRSWQRSQLLSAVITTDKSPPAAFPHVFKPSTQPHLANILLEITSDVETQPRPERRSWDMSKDYLVLWIWRKERPGDPRGWNPALPSSSCSQGFWLSTSARVRLWFPEGWAHCCYSSSLQGKIHRVTSHGGGAKNHLEKTHGCHRAMLKWESLKLLTTIKPWQFCFLPLARRWLNKRTEEKAFRGRIQLAKSDIYFLLTYYGPHDVILTDLFRNI